MWWTEKQWDRFWERLTEFIREIALLWTVFAILDRVVADRLTVAWAMANLGIGASGWLAGVTIELRRLRK